MPVFVTSAQWQATLWTMPNADTFPTHAFETVSMMIRRTRVCHPCLASLDLTTPAWVAFFEECREEHAIEEYWTPSLL
jgi:hypothetical protein